MSNHSQKKQTASRLNDGAFINIGWKELGL